LGDSDVRLRFNSDVDKDFGIVTIPWPRIDDVNELHEMPASPYEKRHESE
jgi:hypothetical protein